MTNTPRPSADEFVRDAALTVAAKLIKRWGSEHDAEDIAGDIARYYSYPMDGFELILDLSQRGSWEAQRDDMDDLDEMDTLVRKAHAKAEKEWFAANPVEPPLPIGSAITKGVIAGIYKHGPATYLVKEHGCTNPGRHLLVKFEDARAAA